MEAEEVDDEEGNGGGAEVGKRAAVAFVNFVERRCGVTVVCKGVRAMVVRLLVYLHRVPLVPMKLR